MYQALSDFYYIPNNYIDKFIEYAHIMYEEKIFLECAIPAIFGIISAPENHVIYERALWLSERKRVINVLHDEFQQIFIHPIKFSSNTKKNEVKKYNYFINAFDF